MHSAPKTTARHRPHSVRCALAVRGGAALLAAGLLLGTAPFLPAQGHDRLSTPQSISFERLHEAERSQWIDATLVRTVEQADFRDRADGKDSDGLRTVQIVEELRIAPRVEAEKNSDPQLPRFSLRFSRDLTRNLTPNETTVRAALYERNAAFLFEHGTLLVDDAALAEANYTIHYLGSVDRLGRPAYRVAVLPERADRTAFVWELDRETGFPLEQVEYSPKGRRLASVTAIRFVSGDEAQALGPPAGGWSTRNRPVTDFASPADLALAFPDLPIIQPASGPLVGYELGLVRAVESDLDGRVDAVFGYRDGLDQVLVVQTFNGPETGMHDILGQGVRTLQRYQDLQTLQLRFESDDAQYLVVGRATASESVLEWTKDILRTLP